jgi:hypothetical protein
MKMANTVVLVTGQSRPRSFIGRGSLEKGRRGCLAMTIEKQISFSRFSSWPIRGQK